MSHFTDAFDQICGNCARMDMMTVTKEDVRKQASVWAQQGEPVTDEQIQDAIRGLHEYQEQQES